MVVNFMVINPMVEKSVKKITFNQWLFLVPLKGGRDYITPQKAIYKWYILPIGGLYNPYHLLGEPETAIDSTKQKVISEALLSTFFLCQPRSRGSLAYISCERNWEVSQRRGSSLKASDRQKGHRLLVNKT